MEAMFFVYLANVLPQLSASLGVLLVTLLIGSGCFMVFGAVAAHEGGITSTTYKSIVKKSLTTLLVLGLFQASLPNRDTMYLMAGAYVGQKVLTSQVAKDAYEIIGLEVNRVLQEKKHELKGKVAQTAKAVVQ